jgi:DMSO/TMAO reductase YedYZ molybdopterin-dependent catalytic subunit
VGAVARLGAPVVRGQPVTSAPAIEANTAAELNRWRPTPLRSLERPRIQTDLHFVRDHFPAPADNPASWSAELIGTGQPLELDLALLRRLSRRTLSVVLECAGHRRAEFEPIPRGIPWGCGAVAEAEWTGARLASVLKLVGVPPGTHEVVLEGADAGPVDGFDGTHRFARSLPLAKALDADVLLAYEMNGKPIPVARGGPVRVIVPGWYATDSVKWLDRIWFATEEFTGVFQADDYRLRAPGEPGPGRRMTELPVHALITTPAGGEFGLPARDLSVRGIAWGGRGGVDAVLVRVDLGPWTPATLGPRRGPYTRVNWEARCSLADGPHELSCRAIDSAGHSQPDRPPANDRGYGNNAIHRIRVRAG